MKLFNYIVNFKEMAARHKTVAQLRSLSNAQLEDIGVDPMLVEQGVSGWPWRLAQDSIVMAPMQRLNKATPATLAISGATAVNDIAHKTAA